MGDAAHHGCQPASERGKLRRTLAAAQLLDEVAPLLAARGRTTICCLACGQRTPFSDARTSCIRVGRGWQVACWVRGIMGERDGTGAPCLAAAAEVWRRTPWLRLALAVLDERSSGENRDFRDVILGSLAGGLYWVASAQSGHERRSGLPR